MINYYCQYYFCTFLAPVPNLSDPPSAQKCSFPSLYLFSNPDGVAVFGRNNVLVPDSPPIGCYGECLLSKKNESLYWIIRAPRTKIFKQINFRCFWILLFWMNESSCWQKRTILANKIIQQKWIIFPKSTRKPKIKPQSDFKQFLQKLTQFRKLTFLSKLEEIDKIKYQWVVILSDLEATSMLVTDVGDGVWCHQQSHQHSHQQSFVTVDLRSLRPKHH